MANEKCSASPFEIVRLSGDSSRPNTVYRFSTGRPADSGSFGGRVLVFFFGVLGAGFLGSFLGVRVPVASQLVETVLDVPMALAPPKQVREKKTLDASQADFLEKYWPVAREMEQSFGVPAPVQIAVAMHESDCGKSKLARLTGNFFGIKCFSKRCGSGHCVNFTDDSHKDFFVKFARPEASFRAFCEFLRKPKYSSCRDCGMSARCWIEQMKANGYATSPTYVANVTAKLDAVLDNLPSQ